MRHDNDNLPQDREAARAAGIKHFFTGEPCRNKHVAARQVSDGRCTVCVSECNRRSYEKDRSKKILAAQAWYAANKDKKREYDAERYRTNETVQEQVAAWRKANPEKVEASRLKWREANPEKHIEAQRKWAANNPEKVQANIRARRARKRNAEGTHTAQDIEALLKRQKYKCAECGTSVRKRASRQVDHIMPLALGGSNWPWNLQILCSTCNKQKAAKHPIDYALQRGRLI